MGPKGRKKIFGGTARVARCTQTGENIPNKVALIYIIWDFWFENIPSGNPGNSWSLESSTVSRHPKK
jgi:hypothetical protein